MWWLERRAALIRPARLAGALALAALLGGCFEPLYGERSLTGGPGLKARMAAVDIIIVDVPNGTPLARITTARADVQQFGINATYTLIEKATGKPVITGQTFARVSYDNPGQAQRFSNARGQRDAENRASRQISDNIRSRLASYFSAGA